MFVDTSPQDLFKVTSKTVYNDVEHNYVEESSPKTSSKYSSK